MVRYSLAIALLLCMNLTGWCSAPPEPPLEEKANDLPELTLSAVAAAVHVSAVLMNEPAEVIVLDDEGCCIWQQPGVALVVTNIWEPGKVPEFWIGEDKFASMFECLPGMIADEPVIYPGEPENSDEFYLEPRVFILDADASRRRLSTYHENLNTWAGYNPGAGFCIPPATMMETDIAVVYLDSSGPLEFHFQVGAAGRLILRHLVAFDFFSA